MNHAAESPVVPERRADPAVGALTLWLGVQVAALAVGAFRVPLSAKYPRPEELLAVHIMVAAQVAASALLFPYLLRDWRTGTAVVASAWPFVMLAATLSASPVDAAARAGMYVTTWLVALGLWRAALPTPEALAFAVATAALVTIGGAALVYLMAEFGSPDAPVEVGASFVRRVWLAPAGIGVAALVIVLGRTAYGRLRRLT